MAGSGDFLGGFVGHADGDLIFTWGQCGDAQRTGKEKVSPGFGGGLVGNIGGESGEDLIVFIKKRNLGMEVCVEVALIVLDALVVLHFAIDLDFAFLAGG